MGNEDKITPEFVMQMVQGQRLAHHEAGMITSPSGDYVSYHLIEKLAENIDNMTEMVIKEKKLMKLVMMTLITVLDTSRPAHDEDSANWEKRRQEISKLIARYAVDEVKSMASAKAEMQERGLA